MTYPKALIEHNIRCKVFNLEASIDYFVDSVDKAIFAENFYDWQTWILEAEDTLKRIKCNQQGILELNLLVDSSFFNC